VILGYDEIGSVVVVFADDWHKQEVGTVQKGELVQLDLPGWLSFEPGEPTYELEEYIDQKMGSGSNLVRTSHIVQPRAMKKGDVLATSEIVMDAPRGGYTMSVLVRLGRTGWVELAGRLPIALQGNENYKLPIELVENDRLATGCLIVKKPHCPEVDWTNIFLDRESCEIGVPSCIPLALA